MTPEASMENSQWRKAPLDQRAGRRAGRPGTPPGCTVRLASAFQWYRFAKPLANLLPGLRPEGVV